MESHRIKKNSYTHRYTIKLNVDRILKKRKQKNGNWLECCSFIGLRNIFFHSFYIFGIFLNHFFWSCFYYYHVFFSLLPYSVFTGLLVYSSSLCRSCALFRLTVFDDRPCYPSNCDGSIGTQNFSTIILVSLLLNKSFLVTPL